MLFQIQTVYDALLPLRYASPLPDAPLQEALTLSRRAVEIFTRLRHPDLPKAQETLAEIEKAMQ